MTTVLRATDSAAFLALVPPLAGFTPRRSIVLLPFCGARTEGAMRLDLPDDETDLEHYAHAAVGLASRVTGTDAVALVVYTDEESRPPATGSCCRTPLPSTRCWGPRGMPVSEWSTRSV